MTRPIPPRCADDIAREAKRRLPHYLYEYIAGGSFDEATAAINRDHLRRIRLRQRVLKDVRSVDSSTTLFGQRLSMPVALGPVGLAGLCAVRGEVQAARAAVAAQIPFCLSTVAICDLEEVYHGTGGEPLWLQLYMTKDRGFIKEMLAKAAGKCSALVFTVDMPVPAPRFRDFRSGLSVAGTRGAARRFVQSMLRPRWALSVGISGRPHSLGNLRNALNGTSGMSDFASWIGKNFDASITWKDLAWVRELWKGPFVLKGLMDVEDARTASSLGIDGIVISNHGGRQLDSGIATVDALPPIRDAVSRSTTVLVDGGIRSGIDVLKMLSAGADGVLLGRAWAYALACGGQVSVTSMLDTIKSELRAAMAMTGILSVADAPAAAYLTTDHPS